MRSVIVRPASYASAFRRFTSPKRTLALISLALSALAVVRVVVCLVESYSAVAQERADDEELMAMCAASGGARSADFRALCMKKRAERAAPIFFKAVLRASVRIMGVGVPIFVLSIATNRFNKDIATGGQRLKKTLIFHQTLSFLSRFPIPGLVLFLSVVAAGSIG